MDSDKLSRSLILYSWVVYFRRGDSGGVVLSQLILLEWEIDGLFVHSLVA